MITYLARRILWIIPVLFTVSIITFILMHAVPGGPWDREKRLPAAVEERLNAKYGLDQPLYDPVRLAGRATSSRATWVRRTGSPDRTVNDIVADGIWTTVQLGVMAFILAVLVGHPARDHRRARPQPMARLPVHQHLDHRHRHAQLRAGDPAGRLLRRRPQMVPDRGLEGARSTGSCRRSPWPASRSRSDRPLHPRLDARGDAQGLHPDGPEQGPPRTGRRHRAT